ncbi:DinB family protein [Rheinheimera baltica]|uniref:DinB family protein n=1 Tax=Rheinheimera baltica TaxID=67576 RepID=A0ABT9HX53_9GAMM|nr:DinB family protein [Rheinheimera baltica]MDP5135716.1 hypothetical protein [Rheinheimera baltica]MDP5142889.1 hypothetical protein [Rheinheimera baltica]MDP5149441.1 hypothetical protein [Rheinheimera baltica]MDP5188829.1 hypothetical protein [Rheinheimera baltica]
MYQHYLATLQQAEDFLFKLTPSQYIAAAADGGSSIGKHMRHILDHFFAIANSDGLVNYEQRQRGTALEADPALALAKLAQLKTWLKQLPQQQLTRSVMVRSDIGIGTQQLVNVESTLGRELMFACSHAIHHYAMLKQLYQQQTGQCLRAEFGLAPSTATFLRQQQCVR